MKIVVWCVKSAADFFFLCDWKYYVYVTRPSKTRFAVYIEMSSRQTVTNTKHHLCVYTLT